MNILCLDISSRSTGWAWFKDNKLNKYGLIKINPKNSWGCRLSTFAEELEDILDECNPDTVIIEDIYRGPSALTFKVLAFFHGVAYGTISKKSYIDPELIGVLSARSFLGKEAGVVCKTKEQAFFIMNNTLRLGLDFKEGNDIVDACALGYAHFIKNGIPLPKKIKFSKAKYEKIGKKDGSTQSTRNKKKRKSRRSKKSVSKTGSKVSPR